MPITPLEHSRHHSPPLFPVLALGAVYRALLIALITLTLSPLIISEGNARDPQLELTAQATPTKARRGEEVTLHLDVTIPSGYHLYSMTQIEGPKALKIIAPPILEPIGSWHAPEPHKQYDPLFEAETETYEGTLRHSRRFLISSQAPISSQQQIKLKVSGLFCNDTRCIPIKSEVSLTLDIEAGAARAPSSSPQPLTGIAFNDSAQTTASDAPSSNFSSTSDVPLHSEGVFLYLLFAFLAGLGALMTPCVFPMIPITVSFFTKFSEVSMRRSALMASVYTSAIILTFTLMGVLVSIFFGAVGMQSISSSTPFNLFLFALLFVFAFNLFGLFEITLPSGLISKLSRKNHALTSDQEAGLGGQLLGVSLMAFTFTLVSFSCTVGFIGIVLAEAAKGYWFYPTLGMLAFSTAFSLPFFFLAMFPAYAHKLRGKGGDWMIVVKAMLGFLELAASFKFLSNVDLVWNWGIITRPFVLALWTGIFLVAALYLLRVFLLPHNHDESRTVNPLRMFVAISMFALAVHCSSGLRDTRSMGGWIDAWLPPAIYPGQVPLSSDHDSTHLTWISNDIPEGMRRGVKEQKPLFIDFTGYSCTNCRLMEESVFPIPQVRSRLEEMIRVAAYTDGEGAREAVCDAQRELQLKRFNTAALPFYAIIDPHTDEILATFADMTRDIDQYVRFLNTGLEKFKERQAQRISPQTPPPQVQPSKPSAPKQPTALPLELNYTEVTTRQPFKLSSLRGGWVLLNFWATWCAPCKAELKKDFPLALSKAPDVTLVTIAFDELDRSEAVSTFVNTLTIPRARHLIAGAHVNEAQLPKALGPQDGSLPVTYLINPQGQVTWSKRGALHAPELIEVLTSLKK